MATQPEERGHTPGPWKAVDVTGKGTLVYRRIDAGEKAVGFAGAYKLTDQKEAAANANLIAMAPELLAAVRAAQALATACMATGCYSHEELTEMARATKPTFDAAIAKAQGEA